jgi:hypothetical protein
MLFKRTRAVVADDFLGLIAAAVADVTIEKAAKRRRWVRIFGAIGSLLFVAAIAGLIYVTVKYS